MSALLPCACGPNGICAATCERRVTKRITTTAVLGLDPGKTTGWCVYTPDRTPLFGLYTLPGDDLGAQLTGFKFWLEDMLEDHRPALLALERPFGRAAFTSDLPGTLCGIAHMVAHCRMTRRAEFTASAVKKAMTGSGKAGKADVIKAVRAKFGIAALASHEADAAAVAVMGWAKGAQA
jgi:Holliday junction resolvasome RuvABC endonuclease subunit